MKGWLRALLIRSPRLFVRLFSPDDRELGLLGEEVAARHLRRRGFRILARRLRSRRGEADLVAQARDQIVVCEVKTARAVPLPRPRGRVLPAGAALRWRPGARCDGRRLARLRALAAEIRSDAGSRAGTRGRKIRARIDLIEVWLAEPVRTFRILHHENIEKPLA